MAWSYGKGYILKVALITDNHAGVRGDSVAFHDKAKLFFDNTFFPTLDKEKIDTVIHLGDLLDRRKYVNINTSNRIRSDLLDPLASRNCHFIAGNHDCFLKSTNEINSLKELIAGRYSNFHIYDMDAEEISLDNVPILLIPWISQENRERILNKIEKTSAQIAFGHLELQGFEMYKGVVSTQGDDVRTFNKFDIVCSGHYHHKSIQKNIHYLGATGEFTWADYDDPRGFHIFDTQTRELKFVENPYKMFRKVLYDDTDEMNVDFSKFQYSMVKVIIAKKTNVYLFEKFIDDIEKQNPLNLQIVEDHGLASSLLGEEIDETESTLDICFSYIDGIDFSSNAINKVKLKTIIAEFYNEAASE